jgi:hypothetical protein
MSKAAEPVQMTQPVKLGGSLPFGLGDIEHTQYKKKNPTLSTIWAALADRPRETRIGEEVEFTPGPTSYGAAALGGGALGAGLGGAVGGDMSSALLGGAGGAIATPALLALLKRLGALKAGAVLKVKQ